MAKINQILIKQGKAFTLGLFIRNGVGGPLIDLSTYTGRMQIRQDSVDIVARDDLQTDDLSGNNNRITLGDGVPPTGSIETEVYNCVLTWTSVESTALQLYNDRPIQDRYQGIGDLELSDATGNVVISARLIFSQKREVTL